MLARSEPIDFSRERTMMLHGALVARTAAHGVSPDPEPR